MSVIAGSGSDHAAPEDAAESADVLQPYLRAHTPGEQGVLGEWVGRCWYPFEDERSGSTHAWAEIYLPGAGWKGFDPTSGEIAGSRHIPVAVARLPEAVSPVTGAFLGPAGANLSVGVWVSEL